MNYKGINFLKKQIFSKRNRVRMRYRFHRKDILGMEDYPQWRIYTNPKDIWGIYDDVIIQYK